MQWKKIVSFLQRRKRRDRGLPWNDLKIRVRRHLLNIANQSRRSAARDGNDVPGSWNSEWIDSNEFSGRGRTSLRGTTVLGERSSLRANGGYLPVARQNTICHVAADTKFILSFFVSLSLTLSLPSFFLFRSIEGRRVCGIKFFATDKMNFKFSHSLFNNIERRDGDTFRWPFWMYRGCTWNNVSFLRTFDPFFLLLRG